MGKFMGQTPVYHWGKGFMDKIDLSSTQRLLDLGCRDGQWSHDLAERYPQLTITAIDKNPLAIAQARHRVRENIHFEVQDMGNISCDGYFDGIMSFNYLHWVPNKHHLLQTIYQCLKPGGKAYLQFFAPHGRAKNDRFLYQVAQSSRWRADLKGFSPTYFEMGLPEFVTLLHRVGFTIHSLNFARYSSTFDHADQLHGWYKSWANPGQSLGRSKLDSFLRDVIHRYMAHHNYPTEDAFSYEEYLLEVVCEKPLEASSSQLSSVSHLKLTPKEMSVLKLFLQGKCAKEMATDLHISSKTVEFHIQNIKDKLKVHRRSEIFKAANHLGIFPVFS